MLYYYPGFYCNDDRINNNVAIKLDKFLWFVSANVEHLSPVLADIYTCVYIDICVYCAILYLHKNIGGTKQKKNT